REHARVRRGTERAIEIRRLDPARRQSQDEYQPPDHEGGAQDQDPRLPERFAEEREYPAGVDDPHRPPAEAADLPERGEPIPWDCQPPGHLLDDVELWM